MVAVFAFVEGEGRYQVEAAGYLPPEHGFQAVCPAVGGRSQRFIAYHAVVVAFAGQRDVILQGEGNTVVTLKEAFGGNHDTVVQMPVCADAAFHYPHIFQCFVEVGPIVVFVAQRRIGRQLVVKPGASVQNPLLRQLVRGGEAGRKLLPQLFHAAVVVVAVHADAGGEGETVVAGGIVGREESSPADDIERGLVERERTVGIIRIAGVGKFRTLFQGPLSETGPVLEQGGGFLFYRTETQGKVVFGRVIIIPVFQVAVVQIIVAEGDGLRVLSGVMPVHGSYGESLLMDGRQVAEQVFGVFSFFVRIQLHFVDTCQGEYGQLVMFRQPGFYFELAVYEVGQERQPQCFE